MQINNKNNKLTGLISIVKQLISLSIPVILMMDASADQIKYLEDSWYVGAATGVSMLKPDTPEGASISNGKETVLKVYAGVDISNQLGLEAFWSNLGSTHVTGSAGDGDIKYTTAGVNGIYHLPVYAGKIHPFGKLGVAKINTQTDETVHENKVNNFSLFAGVGAEYDVTKRLKVRAEYDYFTKDVSQLSVGVNWSPHERVHYLDSRVKKIVPAALPMNFSIPSKPSKPSKPLKPKKIIQRKLVPKKPQPKVKSVVQSLNASLSGASLFASGSSVLSHSGRSELDHLVSLSNKPGFRLYHITISGHTDNVGSRISNIQLSKQRAESVAHYLESRGIKRNNMSVVGYGDSQPIANNVSAYGRSKNRRVEVKIRGEQSVVIAVH